MRHFHFTDTLQRYRLKATPNMHVSNEGDGSKVSRGHRGKKTTHPVCRPSCAAVANNEQNKSIDQLLPCYVPPARPEESCAKRVCSRRDQGISYHDEVLCILVWYLESRHNLNVCGRTCLGHRMCIFVFAWRRGRLCKCMYSSSIISPTHRQRSPRHPYLCVFLPKQGCSVCCCQEGPCSLSFFFNLHAYDVLRSAASFAGYLPAGCKTQHHNPSLWKTNGGRWRVRTTQSE